MYERKYQRYSAEEDRALRQGAKELPGRTRKSVYQRRRELGLAKPVRWSADELKLAERNVCPAGRTKNALRCLRNKMGYRQGTRFNGLGQFELDLRPVSAHTNVHVHTLVGNFVRTVLILRKGGLSVREISEQTGRSESVVSHAIELAEAMRL